MPPTNRVYRVAVIPGDGIGKEVVPEGVRALEAVATTTCSAGNNAPPKFVRSRDRGQAALLELLPAAA